MRIRVWSSDVCSSDLPERVIFALAALGEARQPAAGPQGANAIPAPGDDLVRIALVPDVPHQLVARRVEHIMDRGGQFDHAQPRPQMAARRPHGRYHLGAQLVGELAELFGLQLAEVGGDIRSEEHTSELQSLMRISYAVVGLKKKKHNHTTTKRNN